jgi:hypothetical protein
MYAILGFIALGSLPSAFAQQSVWGQCEFLLMPEHQMETTQSNVHHKAAAPAGPAPKHVHLETHA